MRSTLAMVAAEVGVSKATVSKVLNGRPDVGADTRARVERALANHGYVPVRRAPKRKRVRTVSLVCDDLLSPYTSELMRASRLRRDRGGGGRSGRGLGVLAQKRFWRCRDPRRCL